MGNLTPGATLIYERSGEEIYTREAGQLDRNLVGYQYKKPVDTRTSDGRPLIDHIREDKLWNEIRRAAKTNPALQKALEQCIILYHLSNPT